MRIAMIGVKGLPHPGGIEHVVTQVGSRLAQRGHQVTVFVRPHYTPRDSHEYLGMRLVNLPSVPTKHLDAITHGSLCALSTLFKPHDVVHIHSIGLAGLCLLPKITGQAVVVQSHGLDWQRDKWGPVARGFLRASDIATVKWPDATVVVSRKLKDYYEARFHRRVHYIPNGADEGERLAPDAIRGLGLRGRDYILFASRLVPEKGCHLLIDAFEQVAPHGMRLVIAGDENYANGYTTELKRRASASVQFLGFVTGRRFQELMGNAYLYVQPSLIEGLSTALLNAMSYGNCVLVSDIEENLEVIQDAGYHFRSSDAEHLAEQLSWLLCHPDAVGGMRGKAKAHVRAHYNWDRVTDQYEALYSSLRRR